MRFQDKDNENKSPSIKTWWKITSTPQQISKWLSVYLDEIILEIIYLFKLSRIV